MAVWARSGREPGTLANAPALPLGCERLWSDFAEMHECRGSSGFGPQRITFTDMDAWQRMNGATLAPWEITAIRKADNAFLASLPKPKTNG